MKIQNLLESLRNKGTTQTSGTGSYLAKTSAQTSTAATPLSQLQASVSAAGYTQMTEDEIQQQSKAQYQTAYDRQVQAAQDTYDTGELAYDRQLAQVQDSYTRQAQDAQSLTAQGLSETDRRALSRGMQRSSYNNATLSNMRLAGNATVNAIGEAQTRAESDLAADRTLATKQFARSLELLQSEFDTNTLLYADTLRNREWERATDAARYKDQLALELAKYQNTLDQQKQAQSNWQATFDEDLRRYTLENPVRTTSAASATEDTTAKVFRIT